MTYRNPTDWMWAQAWDLVEEADRMHRQFFRLATSERNQAVWAPPVDVFEDERELIIVVALPGVQPEAIEVAVEAGELVIRAARTLPVAGSRYALRQLEIPYGSFERRIRLPAIPLTMSARDVVDGCLLLRLAKTDR